MNSEHPLLALGLLVAGTMTGVEIAVGWLIHPSLYRLEPPVHTATAIEIARVQGKVMPVWYAATTILTLFIAVRLFSGSGTAFGFAASAAFLWIVSIVYTMLGPVRINNEIVVWDSKNPPENWLDKRRAWDRLHAIRIIILLIAFGLLISATIAL